MQCAPKYWLYGPPAVGKTAVGKALARLLGLPFIDADDRIAERVGMSIPAFFATHGEGAFRVAESEVIAEIAAMEGEAVVALGGGALLAERNRTVVESAGRVLLLEAPREVILARAESQTGTRPLVDSESPAERIARMNALLERRAAHYSSFPMRLAADAAPEELAWQAAALFGRFQMRSMTSPRAPKGTAVHVRAGILDLLGECVARLKPVGVAAVVADENVAALYGDRVLASLRSADINATHFTFPAGEQSKNLSTVRRLWEGFAEAEVERGSVVVALGGGVSTDLGGFAASAYMRGVKWVALPTSLLGMVDAALGGKTGVDLPQGKNLVGAFYPPAIVLADPLALQTLPEDEFRNGMAEFIKHGIIGAPRLFALAQEASREGVAEAVARAMAVKIRVVKADPYESGLRAALNLGHTIGHGVEAASGFRLRHGEAVAIGLVAETALAERLGLAKRGLADEIAAVLRRWGLPTVIPPWVSRQAVWEAMRVDKKKSAGALRFSLPKAIGKVEVGVSAPPELVKEVLWGL